MEETITKIDDNTIQIQSAPITITVDELATKKDTLQTQIGRLQDMMNRCPEAEIKNIQASLVKVQEMHDKIATQMQKASDVGVRSTQIKLSALPVEEKIV